MKHPTIDQNTAIAVVGLVILAVALALYSVVVAGAVVGGLLILYAILPDQTPGGPAQ